jgi:hypothetical protein
MITAPLPTVGGTNDRIANSELMVVPDGGHIDVIDAHWPEVLAALLRLWGEARNGASS